MAVLQKPKLVVYIGRAQTSFEPDNNPKNSPKGPKSAKKAPNLPE